jgi:undecaprenyl-diphosphatase
VLIYLSIYIAAILEGEVYYSTVSARAMRGDLWWPAVLTCGALGGATGDQLWFYILRGRIHWLDRYPRLARYRDTVIARVTANQNLMLLMSRFLPGLRVAIPVACAYAGVRPIRFTTLNLVSAFAWAGSIMLVIAKLGPNALSAFGLRGWWGPLVPAALVLIFFRWLGRPPRHAA